MPLPNVDDCRRIELPKIPDLRGNLSFIETARHVPFRIARTYWIYDVPGDTKRSGHASAELEEFVIALSGSFEVRLTDGTNSRIVPLNRSYYGLYVAPAVWRQLVNFSTNSVCLVLASRPYDEADYLRDYDRYLQFRRERA